MTVIVPLYHDLLDRVRKGHAPSHAEALALADCNDLLALMHTAAALRDKGVRLLYDAPRRGTAGSRINFVHPRDAGGVLVELVEPAAAAGH